MKSRQIYVYICMYIYVYVCIYRHSFSKRLTFQIYIYINYISFVSLGKTKEETKGIYIKYIFLKCQPFCKWVHIYIYIYIYPFSKRFSYREIYIDRYIPLFSCMCIRVHFSLVNVQLVKKFGSMMNFLFVRFLVPISQEKNKNEGILPAILLFCILLKINECGIIWSDL